MYPLDEILLPMNASAVDDERRMEEIWKNPDYVAEEKYDGSRYLAIGGRFFSRRIGVGGYPVEKTDRVPHLAALAEFPNLILDGELYVPGGNSSDVTSILGSLPERAVELQKEQGHLCYVIFDVLRDIDGRWLLDRPYHERRKYLEAVHAKLGNPHVNLSTVVVEDKRSFFEEILARGGEGVILKYVHGLYIPGKRPAWNWIKAKKHMTDDVVILGFDGPEADYTGKELPAWSYWENTESGEILEGPYYKDYKNGTLPLRPVTRFYAKGWIGSIRFGKYVNGELVELGTCSGMSDEIREKLSRNPDRYIGEVIEIAAMERTKDGRYRHPQFVRLRPDKSPRDCTE